VFCVNRHSIINLVHNIAMNTFGERLHYARKKRGLSQSALAKIVGIKQASVSELESEGKGSSKVYLLAKALKVNPLWLSEGKGEMDSDFAYDSLSEKEIKILKIMQSLPDSQKDMLLRIGTTLSEPLDKQ